MKFWLFLIPLLLAGPTWSDEINYNQVSLTVDAKRQVDNDLLVATLYSQHEGSDPTQPARLVNQEMNWALETSGQYQEIQSQTLNYSSNPIYSKGRLTGWRVRQTLQLKSGDSTALSKLLGVLQSKLALQSMSYQISDTLRKKVEDELIAQALDNFQQRAALVTSQLARKRYQLVKLDINSSSPMQPRPYMRTMAMQEEAAAPRLEAGTQQVIVTIRGTIELSPN